MINDSVRQELVGKISNSVKPLDCELKENKMTQNKIAPAADGAQSQRPATTLKTTTMEISTKPTSQTLVEFHSKNATVPEWRLQLQNVVANGRNARRSMRKLKSRRPRSARTLSPAVRTL
jgi:hypothetical protein